MITIKEFKLTSNNWLEVSWVDNEKEIHCEFFGDSDEYQDLLKQRLQELEVESTSELEDILAEQIANRHIPTLEEITEELRKQEEYRIQNIKLTAQSLILNKYSLEKQSSAHLGIYGDAYLQEMKDYISNIIKISNEAEINGTKMEDIQWQ